MQYTTAVQAVTEDLATGTTDLAAEAAIDLALLSWQHLAGTDPVWDRIGLTLLNVQNSLYPHRRTTVDTTPPAADDTATRAAVARLLTHLARHHTVTAADPAIPLAGRLDHDAAAQQLQQIAVMLR